MEVITIDGIEYAKATQLAKSLRYTTDYIGQLCRSGKVKARLVGRTWYVNPESIKNHKNSRYQRNGADEKTNNEGTIFKISPKRVEPVARGNNFKIVNNRQNLNNEQKFLSHIAWRPAKYEPDSADLYPTIKSPKTEPQKVEINLAEATEVKIGGKENKTIFKSEALPEVALRGKVTVTTLNESDDNIDENIARTEFFKEDLERIDRRKTTETEYTKVPSVNTKIKSNSKLKNTEPYSYPVDIKAGNSVFANLTSRPIVYAGIKAQTSKDFVNSNRQTENLEKIIKETAESRLKLFWPALVGIIAIVLLGLVLVEKNVSVSASDYSTKYSLDFSVFNFKLK